MLHDLGLTPGTSGNLSVVTSRGVVVTPTNSRLGRLEPDGLSLVRMDGQHLAGPRPSKEAVLHAAVYRRRTDAGAVVHLHSTAAVAWSMLQGLPGDDALPPLTAYSLIRLGIVRRIGFHAPGSPALVEEVERAITGHRALLLANHGSIFADETIEAACAGAEELEETARLALLLGERSHCPVPMAARAALLRDGEADLAGKDVPS
ncbi:aldolase [Jiangella asiatica]|uniref:Aldolase n=2 Tax=Jiangella asiatica TaxID=2530372 RepID=A0A4V2Z0I7_9ACTN|nr:aldolase [Jiangella asiatica]